MHYSGRAAGGALCALATSLFLASCASGPGQRVVVTRPLAEPSLPSPAPDVAVEAEERYALNVGDEVDIKFPYRADFNERVVVRSDGKISLPLVGAVEAEGKTPEGLQQELADRFRGLAQPAAPSQRQYRIHVNDELTVRFTHQKDFDDTVRVRPDGRISLPLVKSVIAEGKTPEELEAELIAAYRSHLKAPDLVVIVRSFTSQEFEAGGKTGRAPLRDLEHVAVIVRSSAPRRIYVGGEVAHPGFLPYSGRTTAMQAIFEAGGHKPSGKIAQVIVLRRMDVKNPAAFFLNLKQDMSGKATNDIVLKASDVVIVPRTGVATLAQFLDQHLYQLLPIARNSSFNFIHNLNPNSAVIPAGALTQ
jgi:protein involved in polysaccharide export with SLBB domain